MLSITNKILAGVENVPVLVSRVLSSLKIMRPMFLVFLLAILLLSLGACGPVTVEVGPSGGNSSGNVPVAPVSGGAPNAGLKQQPMEITFEGCPPQGDGGDPQLNLNKNRVDEGNYQPVALATILNLSWPREVERTAHDQWSPSAQNEVARNEGTPVVTEGYLALAREEGPESPNCHSSTQHDFHVWMIDHPGGSADRAGSVVAEVTPRVHVNHPGWTVNTLNTLAQDGTKVRISGWLMLDPEHPDQIGQTRGTIWEIHPIMRIELWQNNSWVPLDSGVNPSGGGVRQSPATVSSKKPGAAGSCPGLNYHCAQLTCEQAYACMAAGNPNLDGNHDGIPCNSKCAK